MSNMPSMFGVPFAQRVQQGPPQAPPGGDQDPNSIGYRNYQNALAMWTKQNPGYAPNVLGPGVGGTSGLRNTRRINASAPSSTQNTNFSSPFSITGGMINSNPAANQQQSSFGNYA